ncbi:helix-turn-helix transcriptional regulator [Haloferacaceae archaeon DSL9]
MIDDERMMHHRLKALQSTETWDCVECLSSSVQRIRVLAALTDVQADLRDLKDELAIPRTTLQRTLSLLEQHGWIKRSATGYTTTTRGSLLLNVFIEMLENIRRIETLSPFLAEVDQSAAIDINRFEEMIVTVPEPHRPHAPLLRLLDIVDTADHMRALSPVMANLLTTRCYRPGDLSGDYEFIISKNAFDAGQKRVSDEIKTELSTHITIRIYDGEFPYGLFVCKETVALAAYDDLSRMQALVEAETEPTIKWAKQVYETYRSQSKQF